MDKKQNSNFTDDLVGTLKDTLSETLENFEDSEEVQALKKTASEVADGATEFIRKYPLQIVLGAAIAGFILAKALESKK